MLTEKFLSIALFGIEPVLWILILMSFVAITVIIERAFVYASVQKNFQSMDIYTLRLILEKRIGILATFGNNAPFIGLFGTVLGVIQAFHIIANKSSFAVDLIMQGVSEALVATAAGLFVAIPCVIAYNYFVKKLKMMLIEHESKNHAA
ncbi:MAG TPA: flagellar motor protein MotA [Sulfurospirillum sp. UBA11407]|nr:MAG TPA: flagellar motor protein MotA [Sulfurospirillum sp. UBA11407]